MSVSSEELRESIEALAALTGARLSWDDEQSCPLCHGAPGTLRWDDLRPGMQLIPHADECPAGQGRIGDRAALFDPRGVAEVQHFDALFDGPTAIGGAE